MEWICGASVLIVEPTPVMRGCMSVTIRFMSSSAITANPFRSYRAPLRMAHSLNRVGNAPYFKFQISNFKFQISNFKFQIEQSRPAGQTVRRSHWHFPGGVYRILSKSVNGRMSVLRQGQRADFIDLDRFPGPGLKGHSKKGQKPIVRSTL